MKENMEKDNYVLCPICGKEKFYPEDCFILCNHCGWEGSLDTSNIYIEEVNGLSIRDYKKIYEEYIKNNPKYIWKDNTDALNKFCDSFADYGFKCPCCSEESFNDGRNYCFKCGWKYNFVQVQYPDFDNSSNKLSLNQYKEKYKKIIDSNPDYLWKNTDEVLFPFTKEQLEWLKANNINSNINKLTSENKIINVINSIEEIEEKYESNGEYDTCLFIRTIVDTILENI